MTSPANLLASLPEPDRLALLSRYSPRQLLALKHDWRFWARPNQLAPDGDWSVWVIMAGRGFGKTRSGAEWCQDQAHDNPGSHGALVSLTPGDARDTMVEGGDSSILKVAPPWFRPEYEPSKRRLTWPNGSWATVYSSAEYDKLRGPQHHWAWCDELASWHYPRDTWDMLMMGLRLGDHPRCVVTTTPKPIPLLREIVAAKTSVITGGSTYENKANLADTWFRDIVTKYEGTTLGEQELHARLLDEMPGALWKRETLARMRVKPEDFDLTTMRRIRIGVDPSINDIEVSDEAGIVSVALGPDKHAYIYADVSGRMDPASWASKSVGLYTAGLKALGGAVMSDTVKVVAETNQGGQMVEQTLRTVSRTLSYRGIHASDSKRVRAQPVSLWSEQGRVHLVGRFPQLEDEMCTWTEDGPSPNRLDAMVYAVTDLLGGQHVETVAQGVADLSRTSPWTIA